MRQVDRLLSPPAHGELFGVNKEYLRPQPAVKAETEPFQCGEKRNDIGLNIIISLFLKNAFYLSVIQENRILSRPDDQAGPPLDLIIVPFIKNHVVSCFLPFYHVGKLSAEKTHNLLLSAF